MAVDTSKFGLSKESAAEKPYLASMGIYVFSRNTLFEILSITIPSEIGIQGRGLSIVKLQDE